MALTIMLFRHKILFMNKSTLKIKSNPVMEAVRKIGNQLMLAKKCGVTQPTISKWIKKGFIPPRKVLLVEKITGISRFRLNPEIYDGE